MEDTDNIPEGYSKEFYSYLMEKDSWGNPAWVGIDWCRGKGMIRGEIIKKERNIIYVRFSTVGIE